MEPVARAGASSKAGIGVGRFTSPETMVREIESGLMDMIGAARIRKRRP